MNQRTGSQQPRVSVIVPVYNAERFIAECIESVLDQTLASFELIVVDDGSVDGSASIVEGYARADARIRPLRHPEGENRGVSRSRELAVAHARGDYVAVLDADDVFEPQKLRRQTEELDLRPHCVLCHTGMTAIRESELDADGIARWHAYVSDRVIERRFRRKRKAIEEYQLLDRPDAFHRNCILNSTVMIRSSALAGVRFGFSQLYQIEDWALWIRLALAGPFLLLPEPLTRWRRHLNQSTLQTQRNRLKVAYRRLELLLYLLAAIEDPRVRGPAAAALPDALQDAVGCYVEGAGSPPVWRPGPLELPRLSPFRHRLRRLRKVLLNWGWILFGR